MIAALGYIWIGLLIGAGVPYAFKVRRDWQREDREEALRDASWDSIVDALEASELSAPAFEVVYASRGL